MPQSYPMTFAATTVVTRLTTHRTSVRSAWDAAFFLQPAEELRPDLVAGGEEEEGEEDRLDERVDLHVELADEDAGEERPHHVAETEAPDPHPADHEADRQGQEDRQLGVLAKRRDEPVHGVAPLSAVSLVRSERRPLFPGGWLDPHRRSSRTIDVVYRFDARPSRPGGARSRAERPGDRVTRGDRSLRTCSTPSASPSRVHPTLVLRPPWPAASPRPSAVAHRPAWRLRRRWACSTPACRQTISSEVPRPLRGPGGRKRRRQRLPAAASGTRPTASPGASSGRRPGALRSAGLVDAAVDAPSRGAHLTGRELPAASIGTGDQHRADDQGRARGTRRPG